MKPEALTEYFVQYMNSIVFCCNAKNQDPLYVKNNLTHKTWKYQNQLIQFEKEIPARKFCIVLNERIPMSAAAAKLLKGLL